MPVCTNRFAGCFLSMALADRDAAEALVRKRRTCDDGIAVCLKQTDALIGDLFAVREEDTYAVGWNFNPAFGGKGYATEAVNALFDHLFLHRNARRLYAYVEDHNEASRRPCEKLGMRQEGIFRKFVAFTKNDAGEPIYENTMQHALLKKRTV